MLTQNYFSDLLYTSQSKLKTLNIFWAGFAIYTLSYTLVTTGKLNYIICQAFQLFGLVLLLPQCISLIQFKIENNYLRNVAFIYFFWQLTVIFRGFQFDYSSIKTMLFSPGTGILLYFVPLILLFPKTLFSLKKIIDVILIFGIFFIIYDVVFIKYLLSRTFETQNIIEDFAALSFPCGFVLLTYLYYSPKKVLLAAGVFILSILFSIYKARRGLSAIFLSVFISSYFIYLFKTHKKILIIYLSILLVVVGMLYVGSTYKMNKNGLFSFIVERGDTDTRTGVELYFYDDFKTLDWIVGRGINGKYYCPDTYEGQLTDYRDYIETGYLNIILKGGIISLALYLLIAFPAVILGLFYSNNMLSKAAAIWIFVSVLSLYPAAVDSFSLQFLLVWVSIGICYSKKLRYMPDDSIKDFLKNTRNFIHY